VGPAAKVDVAELMPIVVEWNWGPLAHLADFPLRDKRVRVIQKDIAEILRKEKGAYDAILQDVDNGPQGQTVKANDWLYGEQGLAAAGAALRPKGVLAFWSARPNRHFVKRLRRCGFEVEEHPVRGRNGRGAHYIVWTARLRP
jgi:spermidine synthase